MKKMYKDRVSKTTPVMETTIEGAQKRIIDFVEFWSDNADFRDWDKDADLQYIAVFIDTVGDEMAAITSSCNSLHDRYVEAIAEIAEWKDNFERLCEENKALHKANLNNLHAADDNR